MRNFCAQPVPFLLHIMLQAHFEETVRLPLTFPKMDLIGSPPGLPKIQKAITGVTTPRIEVFFLPLERS